MKILLLILTLLPLQTFAAKSPTLSQISFEQVADTGLIFYEQIRVKSLEEFDLMVYRNQALDTLIFGDSENKKIIFEDRPGNHLFERYEIIKLRETANPLVLTLWTLGVHAKEIRIYDSKIKKIVFSEKSDMEISYQVKDQALEISQFVGLDKDSKPQYKKISWTGKPKK